MLHTTRLMNMSPSPNPLHTLPLTKSPPKPYLSFLICKHGKELHCYVNGLPIGVITEDQPDTMSYQPEQLTLGDRLAGTGHTPTQVINALEDVLYGLHVYESNKALKGGAK